MLATSRSLLCAVGAGVLVIRLCCGTLAVAEDNPAVAKIRAALKKPTQFEFSETPLKDVVNFLKELHGINIEFDRKSLEDAGGINPDETLITRQLKDVSLKSALNLLLEQLRLTYLIENEVLLVTTPERVRARATPELFDLTDLGLKTDEQATLCKAVELVLTPAELADAKPGERADKPIYVVAGKLIVRVSEPERQRIVELLSGLKEKPAGKRPDDSDVRPAPLKRS